MYRIGVELVVIKKKEAFMKKLILSVLVLCAAGVVSVSAIAQDDSSTSPEVVNGCIFNQCQ